jgi:hypothetical protein
MAIWLRSKKNQVPLCVVRWRGPGTYAGAVIEDVYEIFQVAGPQGARELRAGYIGHVADLDTLLRNLKERGGYEVLQE